MNGVCLLLLPLQASLFHAERWVPQFPSQYSPFQYAVFQPEPTLNNHQPNISEILANFIKLFKTSNPDILLFTKLLDEQLCIVKESFYKNPKNKKGTQRKKPKKEQYPHLTANTKVIIQDLIHVLPLNFSVCSDFLVLQWASWEPPPHCKSWKQWNIKSIRKLGDGKAEYNVRS